MLVQRSKSSKVLLCCCSTVAAGHCLLDRRPVRPTAQSTSRPTRLSSASRNQRDRDSALSPAESLCPVSRRQALEGWKVLPVGWWGRGRMSSGLEPRVRVSSWAFVAAGTSRPMQCVCVCVWRNCVQTVGHQLIQLRRTVLYWTELTGVSSRKLWACGNEERAWAPITRPVTRRDVRLDQWLSTMCYVVYCKYCIVLSV